MKKNYFLVIDCLCGILFFSIFIFCLFYKIVHQELVLLGACTNGMDKHTSIAIVNAIFDERKSEDFYTKGLTIVRDFGYQHSYFRLILAPYQKSIFLFTGIALSLILFRIIFFEKQKRIFDNEIKEIVKWIQEEEYKLHLSKIIFLPKILFENIEKLKESIERERKIRIEENKRTVQYMEDVSHQLKTPLAIIRIICEKVEIRHPQFSEEMEKCIDQVDGMTSFVGKLIHLGRLDCGYTKMKFKAVFAGPFLESIINDMEILAEEKNKKIFLKEKVERKIVWFCDAFWMREVIENILKNTIEQDSVENIYIRYDGNKKTNHLWIQDDGDGFDDGYEQKIFGRYFLGAQGKSENSGIGLAIAQKVITMHFGKIIASNRKNGGAEFFIVFPQLDSETIYNRS